MSRSSNGSESEPSDQILSFRNRVVVRIAGGVAEVRLNRPAQRNALDGEMFAAIADALDTIAGSDARAVVLTGAGEAFCAGLDRSMFAQMLDGKAPDGIPADLLTRTHGASNLPQHCVLGWRALDVPVIAAIQGAALGGGLQIALGADIRLVTPDARLALLEMRWGLIPDMGAFALLPALMRDDAMRDLLYSARTVDGNEAKTLGLATSVVANPLAEARIRARALTQASPSALRAAKRLANLTLSDAGPILLAESREQQALVGNDDQRLLISRSLTV